MARNKGKGFKKGGCKKRKGRPNGMSRSGLPKIFPPGVNTVLQVSKI